MAHFNGDDVFSSSCQRHEGFFRSVFTAPVYSLESPSFALFPTSRRLACYWNRNCVGDAFVGAMVTGHEQKPSCESILVHPQWINTDSIRSWMHECDTKHDHQCKKNDEFAEVADSAPTWVVDLSQNCIVPGKCAETYVALSYLVSLILLEVLPLLTFIFQWGQQEFFKLQRNNLDELQMPQAFSKTKYGSVLPNTIRDAIGITRLLKIRYFWVDALCILQDDESQKHADIEKMAGIFARATITLIIADGDNAYHGVRGIPGLSEPRSISQFSFTPTRGITVVGRSFGAHRSPHQSRGWSKCKVSAVYESLTYSFNSVSRRAFCKTETHLSKRVRFLGMQSPSVDRRGRES
jgi:Heterokaryon incompatibility protein (HET)